MHTLSSDPENGKTQGHPPAAGRPRRNRVVLWLLLALCAAPIVASFVAFYWLRPEGHVNYGELLPPRAMPAAPLTTLDGKPFTWSALGRTWVLVTADSAACDERCREK